MGVSMALARRGLNLVLLTLLMLALLAAPAAAAAAEEAPPSPTAMDLMFLALVNLPINGLILLLITVTPTLFRHPPPPQPASRHVLSFLGAILSVTLIGSLVDLVAFWNGSPTLMSYLTALVATFLLYTLVSYRYLLKRGKFAVLNVISWFLLILFTANHLSVMRKVFFNALPLTLAILIVALAYETYRFHIRTARDPEAPLPRGVKPPPPQHVPMARMVEVWAVVILSSVLVYIVSIKV